MDKLPFKAVWLIDFEFCAPPGERPTPVCMVGWEIHTGRKLRLWQDDLIRSSPPFIVGEDSCFVAYYSSAEWGCFLALNWPLPMNILDLYVEFKQHVNGLHHFAKSGLIDALVHFRLPTIGYGEKDTMRDLVMNGGPWTDEEKVAILDYCESDVVALYRLLPALGPYVDIKRALLRGRFMAAAARVEWLGVPIDIHSHHRLMTHWDLIQDELITKINWDYFGIYAGRRFRSRIWEIYLMRNGIAWPRTPSGRLDLKAATFKTMSRLHPQIAPIYELRKTIGRMRLWDLSLGADGRNRTLLSAFRSRTGRNQPSSKKFVLGAASWLRGLIKPEPDRSVIYLDWTQQEFGIASVLSDDRLMQETYLAGDPYLELGKRAGVIPAHGNKESHPKQRAIFKEVCLAVQYGLGPVGFSRKIGCSVVEAEALLEFHKQSYQRFWRWSDDVVRYAIFYGRLWSIFGWQRYYPIVKLESARNYPIQSGGAEMLRLAIIIGQELGVDIIAPLHDAVLIECELGQEAETIANMQTAMERASQLVLNGFTLRTEARIIRYPDRFLEERGRKIWDLVWEIIEDIEKGNLRGNPDTT